MEKYGGYSKIPNWAIEAAAAMIPTHGATKVYFMLWRYADKKLQAFPSQSRIAQKCGIHRANVQRAIDVLKDIGFIEVLETGNNVTQKTSTYQILKPPFAGGSGAKSWRPGRNKAGGSGATKLEARAQKAGGPGAALQLPETITITQLPTNNTPFPPNTSPHPAATAETTAEVGGKNAGGLFSTASAFSSHPPFTEANVNAIIAAYPRKIAIGAARHQVRYALTRIAQQPESPPDPAAWLLERVRLFAASLAGNRGVKTPYPETWFMREQYDDDPKEWNHRDDASSTREDRRRREHAENLTLPNLNVDDL